MFAINYGEIGYLATIDPDDVYGSSVFQAQDHDPCTGSPAASL